MAFVPSAAADPPLAGGTVHLDYVCEKSHPSPLSGDVYFNQTLGASDAADGDYSNSVLLANDLTQTGSDNVTFGMRNPYHGLVFRINTAGTEGSVTWSYWNGVTWAELILLQDNTQGFRATGENSVLWNPPSDWAPRQWSPRNNNNDECDWQRQLYWIKIDSEVTYQAQPIAAQISALIINVRVIVETELGERLTGMQAHDFTLTEGTATNVLLVEEDERENWAGMYNLSIDAGGADHDFMLAATPPGFVPSVPIPTGVTGPDLVNLSATPLVVKYPIKVTVESETAEPVSSAEVTWDGHESNAKANGNVHYFTTTAVDAGELTVTAEGYQPFSTDANTNARNVYAGLIQQTHVKLSGQEPCDNGSETPAGATMICQGLDATGSSGSTTTSNPPSSSKISFTFPSVPRPTNVAVRTSVSATLPPGSTCESSAAAPSETYTKAVDRVASDELMRLCMDYHSAAGVERVDVALGLAAQRVEVRVEPAPAFRPEWSEDGISAPPGDYQFGFVTVGVSVDGIAWTGPVQATAFRFHVTRAQLAESGMHANDVQVYRWDGEAWEAVPTSLDQQTESDYAFSASAPGQGIFAVSGVNAAEAPTMPVWPWLVGGFVALGLIGFGIATIVRRRHGHAPATHAPTIPKEASKPAAPSAPPAEPKIPTIR